MKRHITLFLSALILTASLPVLTANAAHEGVWSGGKQDTAIEKRKKARVKGGSGCDSASDVLEHPQCR